MCRVNEFNKDVKEVMFMKFPSLVARNYNGKKELWLTGLDYNRIPLVEIREQGEKTIGPISITEMRSSNHHLHIESEWEFIEDPIKRGHGIRDVEIKRNSSGDISSIFVIFGPHYGLEIYSELGEIWMELFATHHGFRASAVSYSSEPLSELEQIIEEIRRRHPDKCVD